MKFPSCRKAPKEENAGSSEKRKTSRIVLIDEIRGVTLILMVLYHALYLYSVEFRFPWAVAAFNRIGFIQPFIAGSFILLAGISCCFTKSNLKRGIRLLIIALALSAVTIFILPLMGMPNEKIYFGVLHLLSLCMLTEGLIDLIRGEHKTKKPLFNAISAGVMLLLFVFCYNINHGRVGIVGSLPVPEVFYKNFATAIIGFPPRDFVSADYFPILPNILLFFCGVFSGRVITKVKLPGFVYRKHLGAVGAFGRHTLIVYIVHQPVLFVVGSLISKLMGA